MNALLSTQNLSFQNILCYPDISIEQNKTTFIAGASGSGKSTLLKLFNGSHSPSSGTIFFQGTNIHYIDPIKLRRDILLVSQTVYLFDGSITDNFNLFYSYREQAPLPPEQVEALLRLCEADFATSKDCNLLSGGERQRVYLAICLSFRPQVLLLDEPTSALDKNTATTVLRNIINFCKANRITPIIVSHDPSLSNEFAEQVINISK